MVIWDSRTHGPLDLRPYLGQDWFSTAGRPQRRFRPVYVPRGHICRARAMYGISNWWIARRTFPRVDVRLSNRCDVVRAHVEKLREAIRSSPGRGHMYRRVAL